MLQHTLFFLLSSISLCVLKTSNPKKSSESLYSFVANLEVDTYAICFFVSFKSLPAQNGPNSKYNGIRRLILIAMQVCF
ncbi:hypothetical protein EYC84_008904 [Monilinia fructicola]|uniref:Secreted protein n=1 Tax=Monilinia fructicola TaxID=38448 RepID=A0A5M9JER0_MONFR|nr:hypothetical protein EYC84_008904 [Monilinia fructicola]